MKNTHFKSNPLFNQKSINVDRENDTVKNVVIVQFGENKNGTYFNAAYLQGLAKGANEQTQGVKSRFGHPNMCATTLGTYLGRYKNFKYSDKKVTADLHLDPISKKTEVEGKGITMYDYVMDMAENNPDMFGNSIHIPKPEFLSDEIEVNGVKYSQHIYNGIVASDVVDSPAATNSLFSNSDDLGVITTQFLDENPSIFEALEKDENILMDFLNRYSNYNNQKNNNKNMSLLDKIKKTFSNNEKFDKDLTLANGEIITVITDNEQPAKGDKVVDKDNKTLPDNDYLLADGKTIVVIGGVIDEIKEKEAETPPAPTEPSNTEVMQSVKDLATSFKTFKDDSNKTIEFLSDELKKSNDKFKVLARSVKSKFDVPPAEETGKNPQSKKSIYDEVKEKLEAEKNNN